MLFMVVERGSHAWRDLVDFDVIPVRTSAEAFEVIKPRL